MSINQSPPSGINTSLSFKSHKNKVAPNSQNLDHFYKPQLLESKYIEKIVDITTGQTKPVVSRVEKEVEALKEEDKLRKALSRFLKHDAQEHKMYPGGFVDLETVLSQPNFAQFTMEAVTVLVDQQSDYKRFAMRSESDSASGKLQIRANHHHSFEIDQPHWSPITNVSDTLSVIRPTTFRTAERITRFGFTLKKDRRFITFVVRDPIKENEVLGSSRKFEPEVFIYIDLKKASADGLTFFQSEYNMILTRGNSEGRLESKYIEKIVDIKTGSSGTGNHMPELTMARELGLVPITNANDVPRVVFPTSCQNWETYTSNGFRRRRNQRFTQFFLEDPNGEFKTLGEPLDFTPDIFIYIDLKRALSDGLTFFRSEKDLVLTRGNSRDILEPKYIDKIVDVKTGKSLRFLI